MLSTARGVSEKARRFLRSPRLANCLNEHRRLRPDRPITFRYVLNRAWTGVCLTSSTYELTQFEAFRQAFDEGTLCNLSFLASRCKASPNSAGAARVQSIACCSGLEAELALVASATRNMGGDIIQHAREWAADLIVR